MNFSGPLTYSSKIWFKQYLTHDHAGKMIWAKKHCHKVKNQKQLSLNIQRRLYNSKCNPTLVGSVLHPLKSIGGVSHWANKRTGFTYEAVSATALTQTMAWLRDGYILGIQGKKEIAWDYVSYIWVCGYSKKKPPVTQSLHPWEDSIINQDV